MCFLLAYLNLYDIHATFNKKAALDVVNTNAKSSLPKFVLEAKPTERVGVQPDQTEEKKIVQIPLEKRASELFKKITELSSDGSLGGIGKKDSSYDHYIRYGVLELDSREKCERYYFTVSKSVDKNSDNSLNPDYVTLRLMKSEKDFKGAVSGLLEGEDIIVGKILTGRNGTMLQIVSSQEKHFVKLFLYGEEKNALKGIRDSEIKEWPDSSLKVTYPNYFGLKEKTKIVAENNVDLAYRLFSNPNTKYFKYEDK